MDHLHFLSLLLLLHSLFELKFFIHGFALVVEHNCSRSLFFSRVWSVLVSRASSNTWPKERHPRVWVKQIVGESRALLETTLQPFFLI
jgi:hypothetical protein